MAFVEDTRPYFADFGATATKSGVAVAGIFDSAYAQSFDMIAGSGPVFGIVPNTMHARVKNVLARAGIEHHTAHSLRRTCATEMARRNVPMHVVAAVLRHDTPATTLNYYTAVSDDDLRKAIGE